MVKLDKIYIFHLYIVIHQKNSAVEIEITE